MTIRIGANPIGWSNDDMQELGGWIPLEQCLTDAKAAGFEGMELGNKFPRDSATLRPILLAYSLDLIGNLLSSARLGSFQQHFCHQMRDAIVLRILREKAAAKSRAHRHEGQPRILPNQKPQSVR